MRNSQTRLHEQKIAFGLNDKKYDFVVLEDDTFASNLVVWANAIRQTFNDGGCDEVISTRRLVHIVNTYDIFRDKVKAITFCLNRFEDDTKASFIDLYSKVDAGVDLDKQEDEEVVEESPFNNSDELR